MSFNFEKKDVQSIIGDRVFTHRGLGVLYQLINALLQVHFITVSAYFLLLNEHSPFDNIKNIVPEAIKHLPASGYIIICVILLVLLGINTILYRILTRRSDKLIESWEKTGKITEREK